MALRSKRDLKKIVLRLSSGKLEREAFRNVLACSQARGGEKLKESAKWGESRREGSTLDLWDAWKEGKTISGCAQARSPKRALEATETATDCLSLRSQIWPVQLGTLWESWVCTDVA